MKNSAKRIAPLLEDGIRVLIYAGLISNLFLLSITLIFGAGDADFICNWYGVKEWTLQLDWEHKEEFDNSPDLEWVPATSHGKQAGELRQYGNFSFLRLFGSSHMVCCLCVTLNTDTNASNA
jgi:cathepsin A (carboxypeptidase C)